jgi:hypothetical protein
MELDPIDQGVVVDLPRVSGSVSECLPVGLARGAYVLVGHGGEGQNLRGVDFDDDAGGLVAPTNL